MSVKYTIKIAEDQSHDVEITDEGQYLLDGSVFELDAVSTGKQSWNVLMDNRSYNVELLNYCQDEKRLTLSINGETITCGLQTDLDRLLSQMGMESGQSDKMGDVRAPMPGLVLDVLVTPGSEIAEGDNLIILEAMKMENVIKATGAGTVKSILVSNQDAVEKNQILIEME